MSKPAAPKRWRPTRTNLAAGGMVIAGLALPSFTNLSEWFLLLAALGTFGPGILREVGWLRDKDEFQRQAAHRAGYHAFLTVGLVAFALVAFFHSGERTIKDPQELATLLLALLWFTWFFSSLLAYWGAQKTTPRILIAFGSVWLVFTIAGNVGSEWSGWLALLLHPLLASPFFVLAWLSTRWPRVAGILLLTVSVLFFLLVFMRVFARTGGPGLINSSVTFIFFVGPLLTSGVALLCTGKKSERSEDGEEVLMTEK